MSQIKFTAEELESITIAKQNTFEAQSNLGKITFYENELEIELNIVREEKSKKIKELSDRIHEEEKITNEIVKKYGPGSIDIVTGIYTTDKKDV